MIVVAVVVVVVVVVLMVMVMMIKWRFWGVVTAFVRVAVVIVVGELW